MGKLIRTNDWSEIPVGPIDAWPQSLRTAISIILNSAYPMLIMWGKADYTQFYNDAFIAIQGKKHPEALGESGKVVWAEVWNDIGTLVDGVFTAGKTVSMKDLPLILNRNGYDEQTYFNFSYSSIRDESGGIAGMLCTCIETTEHINSRKAQLAEQQRLRDLFMQAPASIAVLRGPEHVFELANPGYMQLIGKRRKIIGKTVREALPEIAGQGFYELLDNVYRSGEPFVGNETLARLDRHKGGEAEDRYVNFVYQPSRNQAGVVDGILVHAVDATEQVLARRRVEASEARYRTLFDSIDEGFCVVDVLIDADRNPIDYLVVETNPAFKKQTGLMNAAGKTARGLGLEQQWIDAYGKVALTGKPARFTQGSESLGKWFDVYANRVGGADSLRVAIVFKDISEQKRAEKERLEAHEVEQSMLLLREQRNALAKLNKTKDEFIATASHQLRTPATAVKQYISIILDELLGPVDPLQAKNLKVAYDSNERQLTIINDLLKTAQIDSDKYHIRRQPHDIVSVLNEAISDMTDVYELKRQSISFDDSETVLPVLIDETEMKLVFMNLLENASKYSQADSRVTIRAGRHGKAAVIRVADNGVGIDEQNANVIFDKFTRIDNELSDTVSGTGLGLYIVKQIIQLHDGTISLRSELSKGATFRIELPLHG